MKTIFAEIFKELVGQVKNESKLWASRVVYFMLIAIATFIVSILSSLALIGYSQRALSASIVISVLCGLAIRIAYEVLHDNGRPPLDTDNHPQVNAPSNQAANRSPIAPSSIAAGSISPDQIRADVLQHFRTAFDSLAEVEQLSSFIDRRIKSWVQRHWFISIISGFMIPIAIIVSLPLYIPRLAADYLATQKAKKQVDELFADSVNQINTKIHLLELENQVMISYNQDAFLELDSYVKNSKDSELQDYAKRIAQRTKRMLDIDFDRRADLISKSDSLNVLTGENYPPISFLKTTWETEIFKLKQCEIAGDTYGCCLATMSLYRDDRFIRMLIDEYLQNNDDLGKSLSCLYAINKIRRRNGSKEDLEITDPKGIDAWIKSVKKTPIYRNSFSEEEVELLGELLPATEDGTQYAMIKEFAARFEEYEQLLNKREDSYLLACLFLTAADSSEYRDETDSSTFRFYYTGKWNSGLLEKVLKICEEGEKKGILPKQDLSILKFRIELEKISQAGDDKAFSDLVVSQLSEVINSNDAELAMFARTFVISFFDLKGKSLNDYPEISKLVFPAQEANTLDQ